MYECVLQGLMFWSLHCDQFRGTDSKMKDEKCEELQIVTTDKKTS